MSDKPKIFNIEEFNFQFDNIDSLKFTTVSTMHTIAYLKTMIANQSRIISKLESKDEDVVWEEITNTFDYYLTQTINDWVDKEWIKASKK